MQQFRSGPSALQGHCNLRLFFKKYIVWRTVQYYTYWQQYSSMRSFSINNIFATAVFFEKYKTPPNQSQQNYTII